jgi:3D (Asp-Asp-Asp) domain-containing protein
MMKKFMKYTFLAAMTFALFQPMRAEAEVTTNVSDFSIEEEAVEIEDPTLTIDSKTVTLKKGATKSLDVDVTTDEQDNNEYKVKWSTTNKKVATVSKSGKITAKRSGTCTVKASLVGTDIESKCKVTVKTTKGNTLKYGARYDQKVTTSSLKKKSSDEVTDNAGNTYTKGKKLGNFVLTGYCTKCNSGSARATSSGKTATEGITVAVNTSQIPLGTKIIIGNHVYVAQDRHGNRRYSKVIDVFFGTRHGAETLLKNIPVYLAK